MKVLVTGGSGMIGQNIKSLGPFREHADFVFLSSKICDLTNREQTLKYFGAHNFDYIIHLAANVGGLFKNMKQNIEMFSSNIKINENVLEACFKNNIHRGIFVLSSCIYTPKPRHFPMDESMIHEGPPHSSNEGYAYAKRMMELQCRQYNKKYYTKYICLVPVNLYGPYDNFKLGEAHVIPELMHRFHMNKSMINRDLYVFGTGKPLRQFLYAKDFANIILHILFDIEKTKENIYICCNDEVTILNMVKKLCNVMDIDTERLRFDTTKSDGCIKKTVTNKKFLNMYPNFKFTSMEDGLRETYSWFVKNNNIIRK